MTAGELTKEEVIEIAVNWWANKLKRPRHDNGDNSTSSLFAMMMADIGSSAVTEKQLEKFKCELAGIISAQYDVEIKKFGSITLGCDYGPSRNLSDAAKSANINELNFPFKTWMIIEKGKVLVSDGYAQPYVHLWKVEKEK